MRRYPDGGRSRILVGAVAIMFGIVLLIDNLHLISDRDLIAFWPTTFLIVGIVKLFHRADARSITIGIGFVAVGSLLMLQHLGFIFIHPREWWPILLIGAGILVLVGRGRRRYGDDAIRFKTHWRHENYDSRNGDTASVENLESEEINGKLDTTVVMSGSQLRCSARELDGGQLTAIMGGIDIDLRHASLVDGAVLDLLVLFGGIVLRIPQDWAVVNQTSVVVGGLEDKSVPPVINPKRLVLQGHIIMGGVEIKN